MVCGIEAGSNHQSRPRTISGKTNERDHGRAGGRSSVAGVPSQRDRRVDPRCCWPQEITAIQKRETPRKAEAFLFRHHSGMRLLAHARNPYFPSSLWIPGTLRSRPGMTTELTLIVPTV